MAQPVALQVSSVAFNPNGPVPKRYTCQGENINPPLRIDNLPESAKYMALILDDPDAPGGTFTHWMVWDMPPRPEIAEDGEPEGVTGRNDFGEHNYKGPCPPSGQEHRYYFKIYALDSPLDLNPESTKEALEILLNEKQIAYGELMATYRKS